ncbi:hypothetical protein E2974_15955 [Paracoccus yeei]|uniref:hypothetical protein n=1 Tax=Paracoccus yeei TaxID=147645 RepID=UPI0037D50042
MTRDQIESAAKSIAGSGAGWKSRAAERIGVSDRSLRIALNGGKWSADFEQKILAALAKSDVRSSGPEIPVSATAGIEADLIRLAGGDSAGWQQRAADAAGVSATTVRNAISGAMSEKTRIAIEAALSRAGVGGAGHLGRHAGEWSVSSPETRSRSKSVIGEAIVVHLTDPVVIVHVSQIVGKTGFGSGSAPVYDKRIRWIDEPATREAGEQVLEAALLRAYEHIATVSAARQSLDLRRDAERVSDRVGVMTRDEARNSSYASIVRHGKKIRHDDVRDELVRRITRDRASLAADVTPELIAKRIMAGHLDAVAESMEIWRSIGELDMMLKYAARAYEPDGFDTPSFDIVCDALDGGVIASIPAPLADKRSVRGGDADRHDEIAERIAAERGAVADERGEAFAQAFSDFSDECADISELRRKRSAVLERVLNLSFNPEAGQIVEMLRAA